MYEDKLHRKGIYPLGDRVPNLVMREQKYIKAVWTGEFRNPKKGEWYLSGCPIDAYLAPNDHSSPYHIAKLVVTKTETITTIIGDY